MWVPFSQNFSSTPTKRFSWWPTSWRTRSSPSTRSPSSTSTSRASKARQKSSTRLTSAWLDAWSRPQGRSWWKPPTATRNTWSFVEKWPNWSRIAELRRLSGCKPSWKCSCRQTWSSRCYEPPPWRRPSTRRWSQGWILAGRTMVSCPRSGTAPCLASASRTSPQGTPSWTIASGKECPSPARPSSLFSPQVFSMVPRRFLDGHISDGQFLDGQILDRALWDTF